MRVERIPVKFLARPAENVIECYRLKPNDEWKLYITYTTSGAWPMRKYLNQEELESWDKAVATLGWSR